MESKNDQVYIHLATHYGRRNQYPKALASILPQAANIYVYCNDYIPIRFEHEIQIHALAGNLGDSGKFFLPRNGYNLFIDDDIIYPSNYVESLVKSCSIMGCPVGVHAGVLLGNVRNYYEDRYVYDLESYCPGAFVNVLGTGTLCYHSSQLEFSLEHCPPDNMSDCHFAVFCQKRRIPMYSVARIGKWLKKLPVETSIYDQRGNGIKETTKIREVETWRVF